MTLLLSRNANPGNCTVTMCHSRTQNLKKITRSADILIAAIGRAHFVTPDMIKPGAVVIDVGINRIEDTTRKSGSRLTGDVAMHLLDKDWDGHITPVPGGVGPMTIAMLLKNTLEATSQ
jgi:methylenetetrahydrofolate dehydrogenase (NADP+)/methenyltetrahydrofolate cyclohydrolase